MLSQDNAIESFAAISGKQRSKNQRQSIISLIPNLFDIIDVDVDALVTEVKKSKRVQSCTDAIIKETIHVHISQVFFSQYHGVMRKRNCINGNLFVRTANSKRHFGTNTSLNARIDKVLLHNEVVFNDDHSDNREDVHMAMGYKIYDSVFNALSKYMDRHIVSGAIKYNQIDENVPFRFDDAEWNEGGSHYTNFNKYDGNDEDVLSAIKYINFAKIFGINEYFYAANTRSHKNEDLGINPTEYSIINKIPSLVRKTLVTKSTGEGVVEIDMKSAYPQAALLWLQKKGYNVDKAFSGDLYQTLSQHMKSTRKSAKQKLLTWMNLDNHTNEYHRTVLNRDKKGFNALEGALKEVLGIDAFQTLKDTKKDQRLYKLLVNIVGGVINKSMDSIKAEGGSCVSISDCIIVNKGSKQSFMKAWSSSKMVQMFTWTIETIKGLKIVEKVLFASRVMMKTYDSYKQHIASSYKSKSNKIYHLIGNKSSDESDVEKQRESKDRIKAPPKYRNRWKSQKEQQDIVETFLRVSKSAA